MILCVFIKWSTSDWRLDYQCYEQKTYKCQVVDKATHKEAPNIINVLLNMFLKLGSEVDNIILFLFITKSK